MKRICLYLVAMLCCLTVNAATGLWNMPECSWTRKMGDRPVFDKIKLYESPGFNAKTMSKKGMPVGGIGTGSFMYNISGSFGPFYMKPGIYEERYLKQAAFHIREEIGNSRKSFTLATEDVLPAWKKLNVGDAVYKALFPKATFDYSNFESEISLLHFSPVIKDNYKETSYPVGVFLFKAKNTQKEKVKLSFMLTFPNAPYFDVQESDGNKDVLRPCRYGLKNKLIKDKKNTFVVLYADDEKNTQETQNTAWCIGTTGNVSFVDNWNGNGDGLDIWEDFNNDGRLSNKSLSDESAMPSGALCVSVTLKPEEEVVIPFAISWFFPYTGFAEGTLWKKKFTEFFPETDQFMASVNIAAEGLNRYEEWLAEVDDWTLPIANDDDCPDWLKAGALNELYYNVFGGSFWENGCVNAEKKYGNRPGQQISGVMECTAYPYLETFDVRHHAARVTRDLWPKMEKDILLTYSDIIKSTSLGSCPHDFGSPYRNPVNEPDAYVISYRRGKETTPWSEFSPKFIQQVYMYWKQYKDDDFLDDCWLSVIRSFHYQVATDKNNDGITEMTSSEYIDNKLLNAVLWITSLEALKEMAVYRKDAEMEAMVEMQLGKARQNSEKEFWNQELGYYQYNKEIPFLMADAFVGQRCADVFELPSALDENKTLSHFHQCFQRLVKPLKDYDGDGIGDLGAANILNVEGKPGIKTSEHNHEYEVWTGVTYNLAASMYYWGRRYDDQELMKEALLTGKGVYMQCWLNEENAFWFGTPEAYWHTDMPKARGNMYQRVRGIWELYKEVVR